MRSTMSLATRSSSRRKCRPKISKRLEVHSSGNSVLRKHSSRGFLNVLKFSSGCLLPGVNSLERVVKGSEVVDQINNDLDCGLEPAKDFQFFFNSLDLLGQDLLLVLWNGDS